MEGKDRRMQGGRGRKEGRKEGEKMKRRRKPKSRLWEGKPGREGREGSRGRKTWSKQNH